MATAALLVDVYPTKIGKMENQMKMIFCPCVGLVVVKKRLSYTRTKLKENLSYDEDVAHGQRMRTQSFDKNDEVFDEKICEVTCA